MERSCSESSTTGSVSMKGLGRLRARRGDHPGRSCREVDAAGAAPVYKRAPVNGSHGRSGVPTVRSGVGTSATGSAQVIPLGATASPLLPGRVVTEEKRFVPPAWGFTGLNPQELLRGDGQVVDPALDDGAVYAESFHGLRPGPIRWEPRTSGHSNPNKLFKLPVASGQLAQSQAPPV